MYASFCIIHVFWCSRYLIADGLYTLNSTLERPGIIITKYDTREDNAVLRTVDLPLYYIVHRNAKGNIAGVYHVQRNTLEISKHNIIITRRIKSLRFVVAHPATTLAAVDEITTVFRERIRSNSLVKSYTETRAKS